jgi:hypothetical protein
VLKALKTLVELNSVAIWWVRKETLPGATFKRKKNEALLQRLPLYLFHHIFQLFSIFTTPKAKKLLLYIRTVISFNAFQTA